MKKTPFIIWTEDIDMKDNKLYLKRLMCSIASLVDLGQEATPSSKNLLSKMKAALFVYTLCL